MRYQVFEDRIQIRGETDEHAADAVMEVLRREKVTYSSLTGLGAVRWAKFAYFDATTKSYVEHAIDEQMEVISLVGNTTLRDGAPFIHWHVGLARHDMSMIGGHFLDAIIRPTLEIWLRRESAEVHRVFDAGTGMALMELSEPASNDREPAATTEPPGGRGSPDRFVRSGGPEAGRGAES